MSHTFTSNLRERNLDTAFLADYTPVFQALVLAAQAFVIANRAENLGAEQPIPFRLEGPVVDRFWFLHFPVGP